MISAPALSYRQYANIGIRGFTAWKPTIQSQNVTPVKIEPGPLINLWFQVRHSVILSAGCLVQCPFWGAGGGKLCPWSHVPSRRSLSRGFSVRESLASRFLSGGGGWSLSLWRCPLWIREPGGTHQCFLVILKVRKVSLYVRLSVRQFSNDWLLTTWMGSAWLVSTHDLDLCGPTNATKEISYPLFVFFVVNRVNSLWTQTPVVTVKNKKTLY